MRFIFSLYFLFPIVTLAAPIPATTSSILISELPGIFRSPLGFSIHTAETAWEQLQAPSDNPYVVTLYRPKADIVSSQGALTVRLDPLREVTDIDSYSKQWLKDYPRLGFEVLASKKIKLEGQIGYLLDLLSRDNQVQLRQVIFLKGRHAVSLTCRDHQESFSTTLKNCNSIIKTFRW
jgi:hypothetical protein